MSKTKAFPLRLVLAGFLVFFVWGCSKHNHVAEDPSAMMDGSGNGTDGENGNGDGYGQDRAGVDVDNGSSGFYIGIEDVFFPYDRYELRTEARRVLQENVRYLRDNPDLRIVLEGHCDERGTTEYNLALGQKRAEAVRQYLVDLGIEPQRISLISFGEEKPFVEGASEDAFSKNRRVHFADNY
ncbi:MAG: peptidoglycan-associated lipoprotein Pal [Candidatus Eisenbacteria bacterium]|uniref:Peptidoglycan-associated protein n=1 Tax=Eiseniibacteriota bacterium TaxID=2212470 RepID=A0A7Y2EAE7_UNCEI|nr:peptidoglycan-associated lipoprotein Pal [Candidatus Eisenbacteria bacterium]